MTTGRHYFPKRRRYILIKRIKYKSKKKDYKILPKYDRLFSVHLIFSFTKVALDKFVVLKLDAPLYKNSQGSL